MINPYRQALEQAGIPVEPNNVWRDLRNYLTQQAARFDEQPQPASETNPFRYALAHFPIANLSTQRRVRRLLQQLAARE